MNTFDSIESTSDRGIPVYTNARIRPEAGYTTLGQVVVGGEVRWYRYFRWGEHRFNSGVVLQHLPSNYLGEPGITRFAVTLEKTGTVLVVPMCSGLRIRLTAPRKVVA